MKRVVCFLTVACLLLCSGCVFGDPAEVLYENLCAFSPSFDLWTDDVTSVFVQVLKEHPELQVYVGQVKTSGTRLRQTVSVTYQNTDIPRDSIRVGKAEEIALPALRATLDEVAMRGVTVLLDGGAQEDVEGWMEEIADRHYLSYMGLTDTAWTFYNNDFTEDTVVVCEVQYNTDADTIIEQRKKIEAEVTRLSGQLWTTDSAPEIRVRAIHDHLIKNANYVEADTPADHTPYNILFEGRGVCDGYAYAAKLLLDAAGVENRVVTGKAGGGDHRWNLVRLGEEWYHLDITWDDPVSTDGKEHHTYDYYLKSDATMQADHEWEGEYPTCAEDYK